MDMNTPDTDANVWSDSCEGILCKVVSAEFARRLERERDKAREKYDNLATEHMLSINKICNERDEARNKIADALQEVDLRTLDFDRMKQERDEARENLDQEIKFHHRTHSELVKANCILLNIEYDKLKS
jgi:predicted acylesterase/phospholipase RssA